MTVNASKMIMKSIGNKFPDMDEQEVEVEFLIQLWLAASDNNVIITRNESNNYFFTGTKNQPPEDGEIVSCDEFYNGMLVNIIVESIERGYVYVVDISGQGDYGFLNAHEIGVDNFFLHTMEREEAIQFAHDLVDSNDLS